MPQFSKCRTGACPDEWGEDDGRDVFRIRRLLDTEWWNTPDDERCSIARARVEPGAATNRHRLAGTTERYLILAGRGRAEIGDDTRDATPGDVVLIPPGMPQRITNTGADDLVFLAVCTPRFKASIYKALPDT